MTATERAAKELRRVLVDRPRWMDQAACKGQTDLFYVEVSGPPLKSASLVCELCPVTRECLGYAIARNERFGVWGGMAPRKRRRVRAQVLAAIKAGTYL